MNIRNYDDEVQSLNEELFAARSTMSANYTNICNRLVRKAKDLQDNSLLGYAYYYLADAYYLLSTDYRKFNQNLLKAIEYLQIDGDYEHLARCYNLLGIDALNHGNYELALDFFMKGIQYCEKLPDSGIPGFMEFNIGHIYYKFGDVKAALSNVRSAYKHIRRNRTESLYYRNLFYCYCFESNCYIQLEKPDSVIKCLESMDKLSGESGFNRELLNGLPILDTKARAYHFLGKKEEFEHYSDLLMAMIRENKFSLDDMEDVFDTARFYMQIGQDDIAAEIAQITARSMGELNIANLRLGHARLRCEIYEKLRNEEELFRAYRDFYFFSKEFEREKMVNYKFFAAMRAKMVSVEKENGILLKKAETDQLTGLGNRYGLNEYAEPVFEKARINQTYMAVELLDVDDFKQFNDKYGHHAGDKCLKAIAEVILEMCHNDNAIHAFRYGGDEFVIIYDNMSDEQVLEFARFLRSRLKEKDPAISISQGIRNSVPQESTKLWDYMYAADNALYEVKEHKKGEIALIHKAVISQESLSEAHRG